MPSSTSSSSRARAALLRLAAAFALVLVLIAGASEWLLRTQVLPQDSYASHVALLRSVDHADAAFGDSHTARGFAAGEGFINLAFPSEGVPHMAWKAALHFEERRPGRIILQADPHLFANYRLRRQFEPYAEIVAPEAGTPLGLRIAEPRHRVRLPGYWTRFVENGFNLESRVKQTAHGALLSPGDFSALTPRAQAYEAELRARVHRPGPAPLVAAEMARYAQLVDDLIAKGAELCLVSYPVTQAYLAAVGAEHAPLLQFFANEAERVGARYVDARRMVADTALFRDTDHLNAEGALIFSPQLTRACFGSETQLAGLRTLSRD